MQAIAERRAVESTPEDKGINGIERGGGMLTGYETISGWDFVPFVETAQDFIEDAVSNCRTWKEICMIIQSTRWKNRKEEVSIEYRKLRKRQKDISNKNGKVANHE